MNQPDLFHQPKPETKETLTAKALKRLTKYNVRLLFYDGTTGRIDSDFVTTYKRLKASIKEALNQLQTV